MALIHQAGEMAVWSEEQWAAFEGAGPRRLWSARRRARLAQRRERVKALMIEALAWTLLVGSVLILFVR